MKKIALVLVAGLSLATAAKAQIRFGVKAGANFATITSADGAKTLVGLNGGALVNIPLTDQLSLQPEAIYSGQGAKADGDFSLHLNYINVPVLLKYSLPVGVFFETGPQLGLLISAKEKSGGASEDVKSFYKSTDVAWAFGAGYLIPDVNLGFDVRYNLGLTKLADGSDSKNGVFQLGVFYLFGDSKSKSSKK